MPKIQNVEIPTAEKINLTREQLPELADIIDIEGANNFYYFVTAFNPINGELSLIHFENTSLGDPLQIKATENFFTLFSSLCPDIIYADYELKKISNCCITKTESAIEILFDYFDIINVKIILSDFI